MAGLLSFLPVYAILFSSQNGGQRERERERERKLMGNFPFHFSLLPNNELQNYSKEKKMKNKNKIKNCTLNKNGEKAAEGERCYGMMTNSHTKRGSCELK
jgi:hypothetical protein